MRGSIWTLGLIATSLLCAGVTAAAETTQRLEAALGAQKTPGAEPGTNCEKADLRALIEILETDFLPE